MKPILLICSYLFLAGLPSSPTEPTEWELKKNKDGVDIYFRESANSDLKELKVVTTVKTSLAAAVHVVNDAPNFSNWVYECKESRIVHSESATHFFYYNLSNFPWPFADREFIFRCTTFQDTTSLIVHSNARASEHVGFMPLNPDYIRVQEAVSNWTFTPLGDGEIKVEYYLNADPGGSIPAFLVNFALDIGPLKSFEKFKEMVETEEMQKMRHPDILEHK